jgi:hypothetical protein
MTDEQRKQVDELIHESQVIRNINKEWGKASPDRDIAFAALSVNLAIAIMLREMLDKPKSDGWWKCTQCRSELDPEVAPNYCVVCGAKRS